jgi:hypothetical protein
LSPQIFGHYRTLPSVVLVIAERDIAFAEMDMAFAEMDIAFEKVERLKEKRALEKIQGLFITN